MRFVSTEGKAPPVDLRTALFRGLAPDGGLYVPDHIRPIPQREVAALREKPLQHTARVVGQHLLRDQLGADTVGEILEEALDFPVPLVCFDDEFHVLELFHGPTAAFKDVAARVMARLMAVLHDETQGRLTVLTATSGDTGGAVAHAFHRLQGTRVIVLYPRGRVSPLQERQFAALEGNVTAVAVSGTFDDCQQLAKRALADRDLRHAVRLTSANSINIGRLLPQVIYYAHAWAQLPEGAESAAFAVPSGNFGNLTAGLIAKRLGIPIRRLIAATNVNDVVPEYLRTGDFRPRPAAHTISSAMDVGDPSNFARVLALYAGSHVALCRDVVGRSFTDAETREAIAAVFRQRGYVLDPHSAVGYLALQSEMVKQPGVAGVLLATAHPAKFGEIVEPAIGRSVALPPALEACMAREPASMSIDVSYPALRALLLSGENR
ncbi:MAG: threonine synthase [Gemmatimonadales bacterium]